MTSPAVQVSSATSSSNNSNSNNNNGSSRRTTLPVAKTIQGKRRKPRRQSGAAVACESKESVVQKSRLERTDSDKVIRRNSMERKMSVRNSMKLPDDFLLGLKSLDTSLTRMSLSGSVRGLFPSNHHDSFRQSLNHNSLGSLTFQSNNAHDNSFSSHGPEFTEEQLQEMSQQALLLEESDSESEVSVDLETPVDDAL